MIVLLLYKIPHFVFISVRHLNASIPNRITNQITLVCLLDQKVTLDYLKYKWQFQLDKILPFSKQ